MTAPSTTFRACALGDLTEGAALAVEIDGEPDSLPATRPVPVFRVEVVGEGPDADVLVHLEP